MKTKYFYPTMAAIFALMLLVSAMECGDLTNYNNNEVCR